ncbi:amidohydrolase [Pseudogracilibacillus auburnensis]|uniref:Amidohydrolase n=1 Tax=Pseudogracilibacillus auburnensis TaxID=1494959 RepID=A0A2V3W804_9BACI|nr:amidohydrolase [Pseudogracilibacillus auburnensis]PXW90252.1 amidohydrolase [Pseudogracilibacillus auburnensis]
MAVAHLAKEVEDYMIKIRRDIHMYPEVSMEEKRTIKLVTKELETMGIHYEVIPYGGVIGLIEGEKHGKSIILRSDLDALPMKESGKNMKFPKKVVSKKNHAAHMCGHDAHIAMLLGTAKILSTHKNMLKGRVILAFEQGEEDSKGIYRMIKRLVDIGADGVWGIHVKNDIPTGKISVDPGPRMAGMLPFHVLIEGESGHGSRPDLAISPIDCFNDFYNDLQAMRLRKLNPFEAITYSIGSIHSGHSANVIPDTLTFSGTARFLHKEQGQQAVEEFTRLLAAATKKHHCAYELLDNLFPINLFVYNDEKCSEIAKNSIRTALGENVLTPYYAWMASEPFAFYQKYFPGVFAFVGIKNKEKGTGAEHHNAHFDIDEGALTYGVAATVQYTVDFLQFEGNIPYDKEARGVTQLFHDLHFNIDDPNE